MVIGMAKIDQIPVIECVGTIAEASALFSVKKRWIRYCIDFDRIQCRKSGGVWLVDLHSLAQYIKLQIDEGKGEGSLYRTTDFDIS